VILIYEFVFSWNLELLAILIFSDCRSNSSVSPTLSSMASSPTPSHDSISSVTATAENLSLEPQLNEEVHVLPTVGSPEPPGMSFAQVCLLSGCCVVVSCTLPGYPQHTSYVLEFVLYTC
jgi:hypothetical protein